MIKLFKLADNEFIVQQLDLGIRVECDLKEAASILVILGVRSEEIALAMESLSTLSHNEADFGVLDKALTFTRKTDMGHAA